MGQRPIGPSLAEAALQAGDIEGLLALHKSIFGGYRMELDDENPDDENPDDEDPDGDPDGDDSDGDDPADKEKIKNPKLKELSEENARRRNEAKAEKRRADALAAKLKEYEDADKSDIDKITGERDELQGKLEKATSTNTQLALKIAFLENNTHGWHNPKAALRLIDLDGVEIDEEGEVTGMDAAIKKLATDHPYLIKKVDDDEDGPSGTPSGQPPRRRTKGEAKREDLGKRYSALRNR